MTTNPPPPGIPEIKLSYPTPSILLITINRPKDLNCMNSTMNHYLHALYTWYDAQPSLLCAILTGTGRAFCAGADLKEWNASHEKPPSTNTNTDTNTSAALSSMPPSGFGGLSRRSGKKPVICAVNGLCLGGGCEMVINADMVVADRQRAVFGLPEVKIGVVALAGALTRLTRTVGRQRAMEMALTGRALSADEARDWGLVNRVVDGGEVVAEAVRLAESVCANSPDSVIVSREGVKLGWEGVGAEEGTRQLMELWYGRIDKGDNMKEGVRSFVEKRKPKWVASKL
ncbi:enoyl-CoA hydratase/carnithine racemase [Drepanopeziza brunnea f. sp. 'multigermtubi' MB_m1]|uniref:Enoyl-CoA hydratase/carnithine racemase n=2 Tax=Drepanopeziza brunnea f. sp. 'multigermtubi' TaxID=698441 RepID=K1X3N3_MARBU|nr:enoyl-CoA hydratase/carnithine racemase [Drepanopeziza brunnea f. sp. 'multigermtubi' MB_m1]EKD15333.1 enoyl-CoA hydratase/carnithine racemase [Drepanopeziza brunnea f. sp. 'multigermtubi' MB_m1]